MKHEDPRSLNKKRVLKQQQTKKERKNNNKRSQTQQQNESKHNKINSNNYDSLGSPLLVSLHTP